MKIEIKNFFKRFSVVHDSPDMEMIPKDLENVVKEPINPADPSGIFTTNYKPAAESAKVKSIIMRDMIVHGSIEAKTDIEVAGTINGDIVSEGRVNISGFVKGNVSGKSVSFSGKELNANINASERITIDKDAVVNGCISGANVIINGTINGNIKATSELLIMANSIIKGDIEAASIEVNRGAVFNGKVTFSAKQ